MNTPFELIETIYSDSLYAVEKQKDTPKPIPVETATKEESGEVDIISSIEKEIDIHMPGIEAIEKQEILKKTTELYNKSKETVAPAIVAFADEILGKLSESDPTTKVVFLARDAIGGFEAAKALAEKFPGNYAEGVEEKLMYAYLTRKVVYNTPENVLLDYLHQEGLNSGDKAILVDVGMYGTVLYPIKRVLGKDSIKVSSVEYLISRTPEANGFIDDDDSRTMQAFETIVGNPAIHFMEDTYSGPIKSPKALVYSPASGGICARHT